MERQHRSLYTRLTLLLGVYRTFNTMEVNVKQERTDSGFEPEYGQHNPNWEVYGSWIPTSLCHKEELKNEDVKSCELFVPMSSGKSHISNSLLYEPNVIRAEREFVPIDRKDSTYWSKRPKNNESARRSRLKKRAIERTMEVKYKELQRENIELKHELAALKRHFADKLNPKEIASDMFSEPRLRRGSSSDVSETSSVTSEGEVYHGSYEPDVVAASSLKVLTSAKPPTLAHQHGFNMTSVPFRYSFMNYPVVARDPSVYLTSTSGRRTPHKNSS
uniref:Nuclear factor interleukin 3 regulated-like protein n=1 Tax=Haliotis discus discus TaxID=91233 RepID=B7U5G5_HALDI|nr:nuclear factor interleukin 3 regulated-like protein [Haliotis discus discus]